jgi:hypothetical protein
MRCTPEAAKNTAPADIRRSIETATGKKGAALEKAIMAQIDKLAANIECGCDRWPPDVRNLNSIMSWQDTDSRWALRGYETGDFYTMALGGHRTGMPSWQRAYADSIAAAHGVSSIGEREQEPERPSGDPPYFYVTLGPRMDSGGEPYSSRLYATLFSSKDYREESLGLFMAHNMVRVYDYRTDRLVAEYDVANAPPDDPVFYDEAKGRVCIRIRKSVFPKSLFLYTPQAGRYTGQ